MNNDAHFSPCPSQTPNNSSRSAQQKQSSNDTLVQQRQRLENLVSTSYNRRRHHAHSTIFRRRTRVVKPAAASASALEPSRRERVKRGKDLALATANAHTLYLCLPRAKRWLVKVYRSATSLSHLLTTRRFWFLFLPHDTATRNGDALQRSSFHHQQGFSAADTHVDTDTSCTRRSLSKTCADESHNTLLAALDAAIVVGSAAHSYQ
jgi:hypothetical protein